MKVSKMKRSIHLTLLGTLLLALSACGNAEEKTQIPHKSSITSAEQNSGEEASAVNDLQKADELNKQLEQLDQIEKDLSTADHALAEQELLEKELNAIDSAGAWAQ